MISSAIRPKGTILQAAPRSLASFGTPKTNEVNSSCATVAAPALQ